MATWKPASQQEVERLLERELSECAPGHVAEFERLRVPLRSVEIASDPGEFVFVVAEADGRVIYYSDVEAGWEIDQLDSDGRLSARGSSQFDLSHILHQLFSGDGS